MKTFEDLIFEPDMVGFCENHKHAVLNFENGYGVSVLFGSLFYSNGIDTYELAILLGGNICYSTGITDDVMGRLTKEEVSDVMKRVQELSV